MEQVFVSVGSNIQRRQNIYTGVDAMRQHFTDLTCSSVYESKAEGFDGDPFYNLVVTFQGQDLVSINQTLRQIEDQHGRIRQAQKFCARTLDLDLLLFGNQVLIDQGWDIPRAEITRYAFILWPMAEIAPRLKHPSLNQSMGQLWSQFQRQHEGILQRIWPVEFSW